LEFAVLRVGGLANDGYRALAEAPSFGKKHSAHLGEAFEGLKLARNYTMTVSPIIIAGGQNDWMPDALKRVVDRLEALVGTWHRTSERVPSVGSAVILEVADMDNKAKVRCVDGREQALEALNVLRGVTCIANQAELESTVLRMDSGETD
jgi:hypothetical protein